MKILYASTNLPYPPHSGGSQRTELLYRSLRELGSVECVFILPQLPSVSEQARIQQLYNLKFILTKNEILHFKHNKWRHQVLPFSLKEDVGSFFEAGRYRWQPHVPSVDLLGSLDAYDLVVARYLQSAAVFDLFRSKRLIVDLDDYDPDRLNLRLDKCSLYKKLTLKRSLHFSEIAHHKLLKKTAHCWISNPMDKRHPGLEHAHPLTNIPFPDNFGERTPVTRSKFAEPYFLMLGSMDYSANEDAVDHFIKHAWVRIINAHPKASFIVAGNNMSQAQIQRWQSVPGVKPIGFVADLAPLYANALAVVAPIQFGAGTNIKVLESAAFGCATVLTHVAHRGFEKHFIHNESCLIAASVAEMADPCLKLLQKPQVALQLGEKAREIIDKHFSYTHFRNAVHSLCQQATARKI